MRADILQSAVTQQRRQRLAGRVIIEIADNGDQISLLRLQPLVDGAHRLGLQPALAVGRFLLAIAFALEVVDQHPHYGARWCPDGVLWTVSAEHALAGITAIIDVASHPTDLV